MFQRDFDGQRPQKFTPKEGVVWNCAQCGAEIQDLPFPPRADENGVPTSPLYCKNCHRARMQEQGPRRRY